MKGKNAPMHNSLVLKEREVKCRVGEYKNTPYFDISYIAYFSIILFSPLILTIQSSPHFLPFLYK